jgi:single-stranded-DNA-specific exonuclease
MKELMELLNKASEKIKSTNNLIQVVSHLDADGICSASLIASMLMELGKTFQITVVKGIKPEIIETLKERDPKLVIFTDIGSGYLDLLKELSCDVIIIDHHEIEGSSSENIIHINPLNFDLDFSGSGTAYLLVKEILQHNSLAPLAIVGTIGDTNYSVSSKVFETPLIEVEAGLNLFGRFSRPLYKSLELSGIPGLDGSKSLQFLSEIGINPQENGKWKTLNDLNVEEKMKLTDAIVKESLNNENFKKEMIFGDVLTLKQFPDELKDAKEFATILNATANMNEPAVGIALCLGSKNALEYARGIVKGYKKLISNYLRWISENPQCIKQKEFATYIIATDVINENMIGTIVSMLFKPSEKTLIGLANAEDGIKISARSKDVDIREIIVEASKACDGRAGGHKHAAGATIPIGTEEKFIQDCEVLLRKKLQVVQ